MKTKKRPIRLELKKEAIVRLTTEQMSKVYGGGEGGNQTRGVISIEACHQFKTIKC